MANKSLEDVKFSDKPFGELMKKDIKKMKKCNEYGHVKKEGSMDCARCGMTYTNHNGINPATLPDYDKMKERFTI
jgi:hypothetical protein